MRIRKLQSDNWVVCSGNCKRCGRCRRLYRCDEADVGGSRACSTWFDQRTASLNNSSSALSHKSLNVGVSGEQYPRRRAWLITASIRWRSDTPSRPLVSRTRYKVLTLVMLVWHCGSTLFSINEVNLHQARLVVGWVTVSGFNSRCQTFIWACNQPARPTQPSILPGSVNEDQLQLGRKRQVWFIPLADERGVCR